ncbi:hypothetical protein MTO96_033308 [Rhipicephalus appendiculatus]
MLSESQPLPPEPVPVEVHRVDESVVESADERKDRPVSSKSAALDPERPTTEPRSTSHQMLKKRIENIETSLDQCFSSQTEQINKIFTVVNNSVAKLAEQLAQAIAALTARVDDLEARPPTPCRQADAGDRATISHTAAAAAIPAHRRRNAAQTAESIK